MVAGWQVHWHRAAVGASSALVCSGLWWLIERTVSR